MYSNIKHITDNLSEHVILYKIKDNTVNLVNIYIDYDDVKTFTSMLVDFCNNLDSNINCITQLASKNDYDTNKELYKDFNIKVIDDTVIELSLKPKLFPSAMFNVLGFEFTNNESNNH
jgi:hypothetical protein